MAAALQPVAAGHVAGPAVLDGLLRALQRILHQHGNGHGPHTAGHRGDVGGLGGHLGKQDVTHEAALPVGTDNCVDSDVDDDSARLDPLTRHHLPLSARCDHDVRLCKQIVCG